LSRINDHDRICVNPIHEHVSVAIGHASRWIATNVQCVNDSSRSHVYNHSLAPKKKCPARPCIERAGESVGMKRIENTPVRQLEERAVHPQAPM
jgi:hypothetical protein